MVETRAIHLETIKGLSESGICSECDILTNFWTRLPCPQHCKDGKRESWYRKLGIAAILLWNWE